MQATVERAIRNALECRQRAEACMDSVARERWLKVAAAWDVVIRSTENLQETRERIAASDGIDGA